METALVDTQSLVFEQSSIEKEQIEFHKLTIYLDEIGYAVAQSTMAGI